MSKKEPTIKMILQGIYDRLNIIDEKLDDIKLSSVDTWQAKTVEEFSGIKSTKPKATTEKPLKLGGHPIVEEEIIIDYDGRTYKKFKPCKYKCGMWASWPKDYKKGDRMLHINPITKEVIGGCPNYETR